MADFTPEQKNALDARGKIIVSASAGSGKTTVMIEKIVRLLIDGVPLSSILAVTYTNKAAAQMKEKLRDKLVKRINDPNTGAEAKRRLKKQLPEIACADISTVHSFCAGLIRSHFYAVGVDNKFGVMMDGTAEEKALKSRALDMTFENAYADGEEDFLKLLSVFFRKKSDNELRKIFIKIYEDIRNRADYKEFLKTQGERYTQAAFDEIVETLYRLLMEKCRYYLEKTASVFEYFEESHRRLDREAEEKAARTGKAKKEPKVRAGVQLSRILKDGLERLLVTPDYFAACGVELPTLPARERASKDDTVERREYVATLDAWKNKIVGIFTEDRLVGETREHALDAFLQSGEIAAALAKYVLQFDENFGMLKKGKGLLDCSDLEHYALELLGMEEVAKEVKDKYAYVFVDEYQDVNPVQEKILSYLTGENVFLVGDMKQSIYGFRGSESRYFREKQNEYKQADGAVALELTKNFRSADAVLDAVNGQFLLAMTEDNGSVEYKDGHKMTRGGLYKEKDGRVILHDLSRVKEQAKNAQSAENSVVSDSEQEIKEELSSLGVYSVLEAAGKGKKKKTDLLADELERIIKEEVTYARYYDIETNSYKKVGYSDVAILTRNNVGKIKGAVDELVKRGIPVSTAAGVNVCNYPEIKTLIDILSYIDNEEQDIPLCSALLAMADDITLDDLTEIRLAYPRSSRGEDKQTAKTYREAVRRYAEEKQDLLSYKLKKFFAYTAQLRTLSAVTNAGDLLSKIITETRMEAKLLARENGDGCLKRIRRFLEETCLPEPVKTHAFLARLRDLEYNIVFSESGGEDSVRVLTMHGSKGLEFPVVIVNDINGSFKMDSDSGVLIDETYGLAPFAYDKANMTVAPTVLRKLCLWKKHSAQISDELNLYYVALTRAKYGLHILLSERHGVVDVPYANCFADFTDFSVWKEYWAQELPPELPYQERQALVQKDEKMKDEFLSVLQWRYACDGYENLPVKYTATKLVEGGVGFACRGADTGAEIVVALAPSFAKEKSFTLLTITV